MSTPQTRTPGQLKVAELKEELRKRGITPKGLKKDLIEKLEEVLQHEAQEHVNTNSCNLSDHVPAGSNSSPPVVDSTQCYIPLPPVVDYANEGYNSPLQVADTKNSRHASEQVIDHTTPGDFERKLAEGQGHESACILPAEDVDEASSMVVLPAFEPAKLDNDNHKEEDMEQSESPRNSPLVAMHGSGGMYHEREEGADYDSTSMGIVHKPEYRNDTIKVNPVKAVYQDEGTPNPLSSVVEKTMSMDEGKCNTISSVVEETMKISNDNAYFDVDSVKGIYEAETDANFEKEAVEISGDVGGRGHQKRMSEYQLEEQDKKGYNFRTYGDDIVRMSNTGFGSAGDTESEAVTVSEEAMGIDDKNEPRHNYQDLEAVTVKEDLVETTVVVVVSDNMDSEYAQNQHTSVKSQTHDYDFEPNFDNQGGDSGLKQNIRNNLNSVDQSVHESGETEAKQNIWSFPNDKGFKLNETEKETSSNVLFEPKVAECQYTSSHSITEELKSEHRGNTGISDVSSCKRNQGEHNYSIVMDELRSKEPEMKGNASCQNDDVSLSTISNTILEDIQQCEVIPDNKGNLGSQVNQSHQSNLYLVQHDQLCEINPSMTEKGKQQTISALEKSTKPDDLPNQLIAQNTIFHESEIKPAPNSELLEGNDELDMKMGEGKLEEQVHKTTELILEGEKPSQEVSSDKVKRKSEFTYQQPKSASDSPREISEKPDIVMVEPIKTSEAISMDVDFEGQMGKKRKDEDSERRQEPGKRQRRWNSGKNLLETGNTKPLTTDTLKDIIPQETLEVSIRSSTLQTAVSHPSNSVSPTLSKAEKTSFSRPAPPPLKYDSSSNGVTEKPRVVPPPLRTPTTSLKIERFLRPFTIKALKELLSEMGTVKSFWMDQIKTHCYVTYSSVEEAIATRNALYNLKWPVIGGRLLIAEFVDPEEVKLHCEDLSLNLTNTLNPVPYKNVIQGPSSLDPQRSSAPARRSPPMLDLKAKKPLTSTKDPEPVPEPEPPVYTLDDLFKKTRAKPPIYYLPLNEEQVAAKLAARNQDQERRVVNKTSIRA